MGGSFLSSWLMPDVFMPVLLLCMGLLLFTPLKLADKIMISLLALLSLGMHNANPYICLIILVVIAFAAIFKAVRRSYIRNGLGVARILYCLSLIVLSQLLLGLLHYNYGGSFKSSKGGSVFLMGSLVEMGVVKQYLDENCQHKSYFICAYKDSLPRNFLWNEKSPIYKNGGWENNEKEYAAIAKDILTTPAYLKLVVAGSLKASVRQFSHYATGEAYSPWPKVSRALGENYPKDYQAYKRSRQFTGRLDFAFVNYSQTILFAGCMLFYVILLLDKRVADRYKWLMLYILLGLIINAWFCATFSGVFHRYQARLIWLTPLPLFLYVMNNNVFKRDRAAKL
ncbi:MAG: hypothetical protein P0Y53_10605 [Candidatus Pseudobacter hemicellulosilyticus]|uniref:Uncharacterized protein n=1 Tax=Candidatus Pseudobacter hemicellulosilyticus TaxID=3121375 RepID=A0AAJ5X0P8_9BACT|nr:MAG: hypothetical protein P0Y53_10605 [Pseudobacter sp.]